MWKVGVLTTNFTYKTPCTDRQNSPIYTIDITMPGKLLIKASLFDDIVAERMDVFSDRQIHWSG